MIICFVVQGIPGPPGFDGDVGDVGPSGAPVCGHEVYVNKGIGCFLF